MADYREGAVPAQIPKRRPSTRPPRRGFDNPPGSACGRMTPASTGSAASGARQNDMARILVISYSQTGQLERVTRAVLSPLVGDPGFNVVQERLAPQMPYPFPWGFLDFFNTFPETVHLDAPPLKPVAFDPDAHYDLVILAYTVWFLSPALPITAFLKSPSARVLNGRPVITLIACRNMWLSAQETVKELLAARGARLIDNVVLIDQGPTWATFVTTPRWLLTGKKDGFWGVFPPAGVSEQTIAASARFGRALRDARHLIESGATGPLLSGLAAVKVNPGYIASEKLGKRSFLIWGRLLRALGGTDSVARRVVLIVYILFLVTLILTVVPMGVLLRRLLRPLTRARIEREVARLEAPSGAGVERLALYSQN